MNLLNFKNNVTEFNIKTIKFWHKYKEMPNFKFDFSRHICALGQSLVRAVSLRGAPPPCSLTYLSKLARGDIGARHTSRH